MRILGKFHVWNWRKRGFLLSRHQLIIKNCFIHNGEIEIKMLSRKIIFSNTSKAEKLDKEKIVQRFFKDSSSNSSIGLGLSLVKSICNNNNIGIDYDLENNFHFFYLTFYEK